jgi:hypothetical protein
MTLEERWKNAPATTTAGIVRDSQEESVGAKPGVNFLDGEGVAPKAVPPNTYQREFARNAAGAFRYKTPGQNNLSVGTDITDKIEDVTPTTGLTRWTSTALSKAFLAGDSSLLNKYKTFRGKTYHDYSPLTGRDFITRLPDITKPRVTGAASGPSVSGLKG